MEWQPIETAPTHREYTTPGGGCLLLWEPDRFVPVIGFWVEPFNGEAGYWSDGETDSYGDPNPPLRPTHWMPLPAPPA